MKMPQKFCLGLNREAVSDHSLSLMATLYLAFYKNCIQSGVGSAEDYFFEFRRPVPALFGPTWKSVRKSFDFSP